MKDYQKLILNFWFEETQPKQWFKVNLDFDQAVLDQFKEPYNMGVFHTVIKYWAAPMRQKKNI